MRKSRAEITDDKPGKQCAHDGAQCDLDAANGNTHENADDAAEENGEPQHHEINAVAGRDDDPDILRRTLHDRLGSDDSKHVAALQDDAPLDLPLLEDFRVGAIALAWDGDGGMVVIEAQEESDEPVEPLAEDLPADGPGVLRVRITPGAARAFAQRAAKIVSAGRPPCPLCGLPLDTEGHICPRQNGHRASHA